MPGESLPIRRGARQIFESHFNGVMHPEDYARALRIFDDVSAFNERSIAIQFHTAIHAGKLEEVLSAYESMIDPERGFLHLVPDPMTRVLEVRQFGDMIYSSVIGMTDINQMMELAESAPPPKIFDLMLQDQPFLN